MYKSPVEFKPQFKMILSCNELPAIPSTDGGTWRRLRVVDFPSKFVDEPNPKAPNEYKKDSTIPLKLKYWAPYFMSMLIEFYKKYQNEGLREPECVMKFTKDYQRRSDVYMDYIEENIEETENDKDTIMFNSMYMQFKEWHIDAYHEKPVRNNFKDYMERRYGKLNKKYGWKYVKFAAKTEELQEDD